MTTQTRTRHSWQVASYERAPTMKPRSDGRWEACRHCGALRFILNGGRVYRKPLTKCGPQPTGGTRRVRVRS